MYMYFRFMTGGFSSFLLSCLYLILYAVVTTADVIVTLPKNENFTLLSMVSQFGPPPPKEGVTGLLVVAEPYFACSTIKPPPRINISDPSLYFALIERGNCDFDLKVLYAQLAGYNGTIVFNDDSNGIFSMNGNDFVREINIPSVFVGLDDGLTLTNCVYTTGSTVTLNPYISLPWSYYFYPFITVITTCLFFSCFYGIAKLVRERRRNRRIRLSRDHLKKLPIIKFKKGDERYDVCAICLDDYEEGAKLRVLPCQHAFHCKCIDPWLTNNRRTCPICKRKVVPAGEPDSDEDSDESPDENTPLIHPDNRSNPVLDVSEHGSMGEIRPLDSEVMLEPPVSESYDSGIANAVNVDRDEDFELASAEREQSTSGSVPVARENGENLVV